MNLLLLVDYRELEKPENVGLSDGRSVQAVGVTEYSKVCLKGEVLESTSMDKGQESRQRDTVAVPADLCGIGDGVRGFRDHNSLQRKAQVCCIELLFMQWELWQDSVVWVWMEDVS